MIFGHAARPKRGIQTHICASHKHVSCFNLQVPCKSQVTSSTTVIQRWPWCIINWCISQVSSHEYQVKSSWVPVLREGGSRGLKGLTVWCCERFLVIAFISLSRSLAVGLVAVTWSKVLFSASAKTPRQVHCGEKNLSIQYDLMNNDSIKINDKRSDSLLTAFFLISIFSDGTLIFVGWK